jgi:hypothetical protein
MRGDNGVVSCEDGTACMLGLRDDGAGVVRSRLMWDDNNDDGDGGGGGGGGGGSGGGADDNSVFSCRTRGDNGRVGRSC